jgi:hypothetical protein
MQRGSVLVHALGATSKLNEGERIADGAWVDVAEGAEITVRTSSHREITISGPARASVCPGGDDELLLAWGRMSSFPGTGVRPGVEVWIATPLGVLRYSDAKIAVEVAMEGARMTATVSMAEAHFAPAPGTRIERGTPDGQAAPSPWFDRPLRAGTSFVAARAATPRGPLVADLVHACTREADACREAALSVSNTVADAAAPLGERAALHIRARQRARAACETAHAAAGLGPDSLELLAELRAADEKRNQLTPLPARR